MTARTTFVQSDGGLGVVGQGIHDGGLASLRECQAAGHQAGRHDQQSGADGFLQVVVGQPAQGGGQIDQPTGQHRIHARFGADDGALDGRIGVAEGHGDEALACAGLEALEQVLVARVVADDQHETGRCHQQSPTAHREAETAKAHRG